jgi:hypothetical protein
MLLLKQNSEKLGIASVEIEQFKGDSRKPILVVRPLNSAFAVHLYPTVRFIVV